MNRTILSEIAVITGPRELEWEQNKLNTTLKYGELLCKTIWSAISPGTETAAYVGAEPLRDIPKFPRVVGYCNVSEVCSVHKSEKNFKIGDRIITFSSHRSSFKINYDDVVFNLGDEENTQRYAPAYLYHLGYDATVRGGVVLGSNVVVIGLGALGLTSCKMAMLAGAKVIAVSDYASAKCIGMEFGASSVINRANAECLTDWADVVIVTTSSWNDWEIALRCASKCGRISILGFPGREQSLPDFNPLASKYLYTKQLKLINVGLPPERNDSRGYLRFNQRENMATIVDFIRTGKINTMDIVSGISEYKNLSTCYESILSREKSVITYLLKWK